MNLYQQATRSKLRFSSIRGDLTVEQLWDLPLTSKTGVDLDTIAKSVNRELNAVAEESFVQTTHNPQKALLTLKLEIVKDVISTVQAENEARRKASEKLAEKAFLQEVLHSKKEDALKGLSVEEIEERLSKL